MIGALLLSVALTTASDVSRWHDARAIVLPAVRAPIYVRLRLPREIDAGPEGTYPDLRVADERGNEVPYVLDPASGSTAAVPGALSDVGFVRGRFTQGIADFGASGEQRDALTIVTSRPTFFQRVEVATSDDRKTWSVVRTDALIYRVAGRDAGTQTIDFGPSRSRWIRLRIFDGTDRFPIDGVTIQASAPQSQLVTLDGAAHTQNDPHSTITTIDLGAPNVDVAGIAFDAVQATFSRGVTIASSGDGAAWNDLARDTISRFAKGAPHLVLTVDGVRARYVRVTVSNGNDTPIQGLRAHVLGHQHNIVFSAKPGHTYRLLWGSAAGAPTYDLANRLEHEPWHIDAIGRLGATAPAGLIVASSPSPTLADRIRVLALPLTLIGAVIMLGIVTLAALRRAPP